ncbi:MAG: hypothetical protein FWE58_03330 [Methanobrevibacter sp.]|nr:hypothetical protein [Methanobrevibacter sp.]
MLIAEDFIKYNNSSFEIKTQIWKKETDLFIHFQEENNKNIFLKDFLAIIQEEITWIENNKSKLEEVLLGENVLELVENIAISAPLLECSSEECYLMSDDSIVYFPITEDDLYNSLYIETMTINFDKESKSSFEILLSCNPDYLQENSFILKIDKNKNIVFMGLLND